MDYGHWSIACVGEFDPTEWFGFIYLITNTVTGQKYIGKKQFQFAKRRQVKRRSVKMKVDSDWRTYTSSSVVVQQDIQTLGPDKFLFDIVQLCSGKAELSYLEEQFQYGAKILTSKLPNGTPEFYNRTVAHRHFAGVETQSAHSSARMNKLLVAYHVIAERRAWSEQQQHRINAALHVV